MRITIGIPCFSDPPAETFEDYIRFAYYLGRRVPEHDFALAIKTKMEQFRARNSIVSAALQWGSDYLLMLDDDHVIDWEQGGCYAPSQINDRYGFITQLIKHLQDDPKRGIVGCLYYHRGGDCLNVIMKEGTDGGYYYFRDDEITNGLQEVAVQGGGCMLINMNVFSVIEQPWFESESARGIGTDMQLAKKARQHGFSVWCDTSIVLGHVLKERTIVNPKNRNRVIAESAAKEGITKGIDPRWTASTALRLYSEDAQEYLQLNEDEITELANTYNVKNMPRFDSFKNPDDYYRSLGLEQLARQVWFHHTERMKEEAENFFSLIDTSTPYNGVDFGCGSAPIGFELALRGHYVDFIDLDGTPAYEFTKWRAKRRNVTERCGFDLKGPYDYALFMDSIEHLKDWKKVLEDVIDRLKENGTLFTNFFFNMDFENCEHVNMDHAAVASFLVERGLYPVQGKLAWCKRDLNFMMKSNQSAA